MIFKKTKMGEKVMSISVNALATKTLNKKDTSITIVTFCDTP